MKKTDNFFYDFYLYFRLNRKGERIENTWTIKDRNE